MSKDNSSNDNSKTRNNEDPDYSDLMKAGDIGQGIEENGNSSTEKVVPPRPSNVISAAEAEKLRVDKLISDIEQRLRVGSSVDDLEQAYLIYCEYGRSKGFGVRKGEQRYFGRTDELKWKEYVCSCAGLNDGPKSVGDVSSYKKLLLRTGCKAKIRVGRPAGQPWRVKIFETEHNHELVPSDQTYMLRSSRNLSYAKQSILEALTSAGIGVSGACGFMEREVGGPQNLGFTRQDAYDHLRAKKRRTKLENGDSIALLEYFIQKSNSEQFFYWKVQLDDDHRIMNFFFRDARCAEDYRAFGDVLSVDTTHKTNCYNLMCAPFVGMNHHTLNVLFGVGFLSDETTSSFEWLFGAFLESMSGVEPKVIFTDQCRAMMNALDTTLPNTTHRLCQWHINRNAAQKFGSLFGNSAFKKLWHICTNEAESEKEFEDAWKEMSSYKELEQRNWFNGMYELRHRWACVFTRGIFTAGMLATSRSEGANRVLKVLHRSSTTLYEFVINYVEVQDRWRRKEREEDTLSIWKPGQFVSDNELFTQAASVYTRKVYKLFEVEAKRALNVVVSHDMEDKGDGTLVISARTLNAKRLRKIIWNKYTHVASCSCRKLESEGILCRHIIKTYYFMNVFTIPDCQILQRWTRRARDGFNADISDLPIRLTLPGMLFVNTVMRQMYDLASPCIEHEEACQYILKQIEKMGREVIEIMGLPKPIAKSNVLSKLNTNEVDGVIFRDPKYVIDERLKATRMARKREAKQSKVSFPWFAKQKKEPPSTTMPFVPSDYIPVHPSSAPPKVTVNRDDCLDMSDEAFLFNYSQLH